MKKITLKQPIMKKPPGGLYKFIDDGVEFSDEELEKLISKVKRNRSIHNKNLGEPEREVMQYIYQMWPHLCNIEHVEEPSNSSIQSTEERAYSWLMGLKGSDHTVDIKHNQIKRAEICAKCPHNVRPSFSDSEMARQYHRLVFIVCQGRLMGGGHDLGLCSFYGWDNRIMCSKKNPEPPELTPPENCWLNEEV